MLNHLKNHLCDYIPNRVFSDIEQAVHTTVKDVWFATTLKEWVSLVSQNAVIKSYKNIQEAW